MNAVVALGNVEIHGLPPRQAETLAHTVLGRSAKETARAMHISPNTVVVNLNILMERFGAANRVHLLTQTVAAGVVTIKRTAQVLTVAAVLTFAGTTASVSPDDLARVSGRTQRTRRGRDEFALESLLEDDA